MLNKQFLRTDAGKRHAIAYALHVHYHVYLKDIARYYDCSSSTISYWVRNLKQYSHLKDFTSIIDSYYLDIQMILKNIQSTEE